jgi:hypothetical protein
MAHISTASMSGRTNRSLSRGSSLDVSKETPVSVADVAVCVEAVADENELVPTNPLVCALLTDMYQISMTYAYWKNGKADDPAVFDLFFRKAPFQGEFCVSDPLLFIVSCIPN